MLISVVIPTRRRNDQLAECLSSLAPGRQTRAEIVAADNRARDVPNEWERPEPSLTYEVVVGDDDEGFAAKQLVTESFPWARWVEGPHRGPAANRNATARVGRGEWIVFIDDDCEPQSGWLHALSEHFGADVVEGRTICPSGRDDPFEEHVENLTGGNFWSCNLAIRRRVFEELGGFDEDFLDAAGEDMEFAWRIRRGSFRAVFAREAEVIHPARRISWRKLVWRTWLLRWRLLYRLKTGDAPPLAASNFRVTVALAASETMELLRLTWQLFTRCDPKRPRSQLFHTVRRLITFPVVLPYLLVWEFRFRRQLVSRQDTSKHLV